MHPQAQLVLLSRVPNSQWVTAPGHMCCTHVCKHFTEQQERENHGTHQKHKLFHMSRIFWLFDYNFAALFMTELFDC
jgi:hypothetical protein